MFGNTIKKFRIPVSRMRFNIKCNWWSIYGSK